MSRFRSVLTLLLLMSLGCASSAHRDAENTTGVVNYADAKHGLRLMYDGQWKEQSFLKPRGTLLVLVSDEDASRLPPTVSIVAQPERKNSNAPDLGQMEQRLIERAQKQIGDFALVETSDTTVAGQPARRVTYTGRKLGMSLQVMNVITIHDNRGYAIAYMADPATFDRRRFDVDRIIATIAWMN